MFDFFFHLDSPILLSFPHFYMGDQSLRLAVEGIAPPEKEKHQFFLDVQPVSTLNSCSMHVTTQFVSDCRKFI